MKNPGRIWRFSDPRRQGVGLMLLLLVPPAFCLFGGSARAEQSSQAAAARTSTYVLVPAESTVVRTGGIAGLVRRYSVKGQLRLTVDSDAGAASFSQVDATLTGEDGVLYAQSLDALFNMAGLAGTVIDDATIQFEGKTADGTDSDVRLTLTLTDDSARLAGTTTPPPNSADMFFYDLNAVALRKYAGGTGEPNTPYLVGTPEQMNAIGAEPNDWDKHFKLIADIDLGGYSGTDFHIIAPVRKGGRYFTGLFDGGGHTISNFTYSPADVNSVALFGNVKGRIENVGLIDPNVAGTREGIAPLVDWLNEGSMRGCYVRGGTVSGNEWVGGLVAYNTGIITDCFSTAAVDGQIEAGGLAGYNNGVIAGCSSTGGITGKRSVGGLLGWNDGTVTGCSSTRDVTGNSRVGGLVGDCGFGIISNCSSTGRATGVSDVAGLVGRSYGLISNCYSTGEVFGDLFVGGLVGFQFGEVFNCYSTGGVTGRLKVGGLVGTGFPEDVLDSFWDIQTSGQTTSTGGIGKTTDEMHTAGTFLEAGWDFVGETANGMDDIWKIAEGTDYPRISLQQVLLADDFKDGVAPPLWQAYEPDEQKIWVEETNGRLEVRASEAADNINAAYVSNGWRLDVTNDFKMKVNFHYGKRSAGDSWVMIALAPSLEQPISRIITFEAGCLDYQWFYLYEAIDGTWRTEETSDRSSDDGTLYVSFSADKDELYLGFSGYGKSNAWWTVAGLLKGRWGNAPVYVGLGGGSDQASLDAGDAYLDDFVVSGLLQ